MRTPRKLKKGAARVAVRDFCMDTDYPLSCYYKRYLIFRAVIIECIILYIHIVFLALYIHSSRKIQKYSRNFQLYMTFVYYDVMNAYKIYITILKIFKIIS